MEDGSNLITYHNDNSYASLFFQVHQVVMMIKDDLKNQIQLEMFAYQHPTSKQTEIS